MVPTNIRLQRFLDAIHRWQQVYRDVRLSFIHREGNRCAGRLVKESLTNNVLGSIFTYCLMFVNFLYNSDLANS